MAYYLYYSSICRLLFLADFWNMSMLFKINFQPSTCAYYNRTEQDNLAWSCYVTLLLSCKFFCSDQLFLIVIMRIHLFMTFSNQCYLCVILWTENK